MKIAIIGVGNVGGALGKGWAKNGHQVVFGVRNASEPKVAAAVKDCHAMAGRTGCDSLSRKPERKNSLRLHESAESRSFRIGCGIHHICRGAGSILGSRRAGRKDLQHNWFEQYGRPPLP